MGIKMHDCSLCLEEFSSRVDEPVIKGKYSFYKNYVRDVGVPTARRTFLYCPKCTRTYLKWMQEIVDARPQKVDE